MLDKETNEAIGYSLITSYWCNEEGGNVLVLDELYISPSGQHHGYASKFVELASAAVCRTRCGYYIGGSLYQSDGKIAVRKGRL